MLYGRLDEGGTIMLRVKMVMQKRYISELKTKLTNKEKVETIKENKPFAKFTIKWFWGSIVILGGWLLWKNRKKIFSLITKIPV